MSLNAIVVISDSLRRACRSCHSVPSWASRFATGIGHVHTPHLDRFSQRALIFDNAYFASSPTVPTRAEALHANFVTVLEETQVPEKHLRSFRNLNA